MPPDPYQTDEDDDDTSGQQTNPVADARAHADQLNKELKAERKARAALEAQVARINEQTRTDTAKAQFKEMGLNESQAALFLKANPEVEITAEAVGNFAHEYGLIQPEPSREQAPQSEPTPAPSTFVPVPGTPPPPAASTSSSFREQYLADPHGTIARLNSGSLQVAGLEAMTEREGGIQVDLPGGTHGG